mmetsp:Transcript_22338/g.88677  ORF Transcript_22338/g.88677 Transcript_22338/m.88677 type:complete len:261 (+) Transcript_22338:1336-2118(+)
MRSVGVGDGESAVGSAIDRIERQYRHDGIEAPTTRTTTSAATRRSSQRNRVSRSKMFGCISPRLRRVFVVVVVVIGASPEAAEASSPSSSRTPSPPGGTFASSVVQSPSGTYPDGAAAPSPPASCGGYKGSPPSFSSDAARPLDEGRLRVREVTAPSTRAQTASMRSCKAQSGSPTACSTAGVSIKLKARAHVSPTPTETPTPRNTDEENSSNPRKQHTKVVPETMTVCPAESSTTATRSAGDSAASRRASKYRLHRNSE